MMATLNTAPHLVPLFFSSVGSLAGIPEAAGDWVWCLGLLVVGMPHGAYDLAAIRKASSSPRRAVSCFALYTATMVLCGAGLLLFPTATVAAFLLLAAYHFGTSDCVWTRGLARFPVFDHLAGLGRGLVVIAAPFVFRPAESWSPFAEIAGSAGAAPTHLPETAAAAAAAVVLVGMCFTLARTLRPPTTLKEALEECLVILAVLVLSATTPPFFAVGVYFVAVHALGHCLRATTPGRPAPARPLLNAWRVHVESLPLLIPSIAMVLAAAWLHGGITPANIMLAFLGFCVVATLPHHLLWHPLGAPTGQADSGRSVADGLAVSRT